MDYFQLKSKTKKEIRSYGIISALCILGFFIFQEGAGVILQIFGVYNIAFGDDETLYECSSLLLTVFSLVVPYLISIKFLKKKTDIDLCPLDKPKSAVDTLLAIPSGVMFCFLGSLATSYFVSILSVFGVELTTPDMSSPKEPFALLIYILRLSVLAAITEEFAMRGLVMQPLRKYGNWFAIIMSSFIFAVLHRNLVQAPFAFIAGIALGYFTIITGSMWTGLIIHLINNGISGLSEYLTAKGYGEKGEMFISIVIYALIAIGIVCFVIFKKRNHNNKLDGNEVYPMTFGEKAKAYILHPSMIIALIFVCFYTTFFIKLV